jgi:hypothetical protein
MNTTALGTLLFADYPMCLLRRQQRLGLLQYVGQGPEGPVEATAAVTRPGRPHPAR